MKKISVMAVLVGSLLATASNGFPVLYGRNVGGSWHETTSTWKVGDTFVSTLPEAEDSVALVSADETIDLSGDAVTILAITIGAWDTAMNKLVTLDVQTNFTTTNVINIGSTEGKAGNGAMVVSGAAVITAGTTSIGHTSAGSLTLNKGAKFSNSTWRVDMGPQATVTLNDGVLSMVNSLLMVDGARLDLNGDAELWILNNDQTQSGDPLMQYIAAGWIYGNGEAGNVRAAYDGEKTILRVRDK